MSCRSIKAFGLIGHLFHQPWCPCLKPPCGTEVYPVGLQSQGSTGEDIVCELCCSPCALYTRPGISFRHSASGKYRTSQVYACLITSRRSVKVNLCLFHLDQDPRRASQPFLTSKKDETGRGAAAAGPCTMDFGARTIRMATLMSASMAEIYCWIMIPLP